MLLLSAIFNTTIQYGNLSSFVDFKKFEQKNVSFLFSGHRYAYRELLCFLTALCMWHSTTKSASDIKHFATLPFRIAMQAEV